MGKRGAGGGGALGGDGGGSSGGGGDGGKRVQQPAQTEPQPRLWVTLSASAQDTSSREPHGSELHWAAQLAGGGGEEGGEGSSGGSGCAGAMRTYVRNESIPEDGPCMTYGESVELQVPCSQIKQ